MNKYYGKIGFAVTEETVPGVWEEKIKERGYYGDVITNRQRWEPGQSINDNVNVNNQISIVMDPFAFEHLSTIKYLEYAGALWKVTNVEIHSPRLLLSFGGVYNG